MRTEPEMLDLILQTAKSLKVEAVAMSGSRTDTKAPKDEFQDYDVVYVVDDLDNLTDDLTQTRFFKGITYTRQGSCKVQVKVMIIFFR